MWLINAHSLLYGSSAEFREFFGSEIPPYAILSHRWGDDEVLFEDIYNRKLDFARKKKGFSKLKGCCLQALKDGHKWVWADQCCIRNDKPTEKSESINSMYQWYAKSRVCYAHLDDVDRRMVPSFISRNSNRLCKEQMAASVWFTRGWTLQELIAPASVEFYNHSWEEIGTKHSLAKDLATITGVPVEALLGGEHVLKRVSAACKLSWAARRKTGKEEDMAYCLLGIFDVHLNLLYGEGTKAFQRLLEEVMRQTEDYTLLLGQVDWGGPAGLSSPDIAEGALATKPILFHEPHQIEKYKPLRHETLDWADIWCDFDSVESTKPATLTSRGLHSNLYTKFNPTREWNEGDPIEAWTNCMYQKGYGTGRVDNDEPKYLVCFTLHPYQEPIVSSQGVVHYPSHNPSAQPRWTPVHNSRKEIRLVEESDRHHFKPHDMLLVSWVKSIPWITTDNRDELWSLIVQPPELFPDGRKGPDFQIRYYSDRLKASDGSRHRGPHVKSELAFTGLVGSGPREWAQDTTLDTNTAMPLMNLMIEFNDPTSFGGRAACFVTIYVNNLLRESVCCDAAELYRYADIDMRKRFEECLEGSSSFYRDQLRDRTAVEIPNDRKTSFLSFNCKQFNADTNVLKISFEECTEEEAYDLDIDDFS